PTRRSSDLDRAGGTGTGRQHRYRHRHLRPGRRPRVPGADRRRPAPVRPARRRGERELRRWWERRLGAGLVRYLRQQAAGLRAAPRARRYRRRRQHLAPARGLAGPGAVAAGPAVRLAPAGPPRHAGRVIQAKRVYDRPEPTDGRRVLVDRLWPRGLRKESANWDEWLKDAAPSAELRTWYGHDPA